MVRWNSSPTVRPELMTPVVWVPSMEPEPIWLGSLSSRYRFSSGKADRSELNSLRPYFGSVILLAILLALAQSVETVCMQAHSTVLGGCFSGCACKRILMPPKPLAESVGNGTRWMSRFVSKGFIRVEGAVAEGGTTSVPDDDLMLKDFDPALRVRGATVVLRSHVQMFNCVPMAWPWSHSWPLKLKSPSAVANSWPSGKPMSFTPECSGSRTRNWISWMQ
mmetsp:Transcript_49772/g.160921  ORF Transcript_49772/g.160921 Transcript_49772/m.160921 type:complete len:221 (+) Transcript_49772:1485-2147(+)